jgi:alpha-1,6-mannosyltransferase
VRFTPSSRLCILGVILLVALTICSRNVDSWGAPSFMVPLAVAGLAYLLAVREFFVTPKFPVPVIATALVLAAVWQLLFLRLPPGTDDDIHRYLWDGRMQRLGYNSYLIVPNDPSLATLHTPETRTLNHPDLPSPYPPGAELFFRAAAAIHESIFGLKVAFAICDWAIVLLLLDLLPRSDQGAHWVLAYAWNPLLATEGSGHVDILGALLLLMSLAALARRWRTLAAVTFALAVAVKFLPIVLLPLYWKRVRVRDAGLALILVGLLYVPFLNHGRLPIGSLGTYVQSFRFNDPVFASLERIWAPQFVAGLAVLVGLITAMSMRGVNKNPGPTAAAFAWPMAASLLFAPVVYPWYLLWILPFVRSTATLPLIIWSVSIIPTYYVWHLRALGRPWMVPGWALLLEFGSLAIAAVTLCLHRVSKSDSSHNLED